MCRLILFILIMISISCRSTVVYVIIPNTYTNLSYAKKMQYAGALYEVNLLNYNQMTNKENKNIEYRIYK